MTQEVDQMSPFGRVELPSDWVRRYVCVPPNMCLSAFGGGMLGVHLRNVEGWN